MKEEVKNVLLTKISKVLITILLLLVLANTGLAIYNFRAIADKKEPVILTTKVETENKTVYKQCLFNVIKQKTTDVQTQNQEIRIVLRPFFLD